MIAPGIPEREEARLAILNELEILDTANEAALDELTALAAEVLGVPTVLISLVDRNRQWFKSKLGLDTTETPRSVSFCGHAILDSKTLIVEDASEDLRFFDNPLVVGAPHISFYAGVPLEVQGELVGAFCAMDSKKRVISDRQKELLELIARQVQTQLKHRHAVITSKKLNVKLLELTLEIETESSKLAALSKNKANFYSQMNHEIRTPLQGLLGSLELMSQVQDLKARDEYQKSAAACAEFLLSVTSDILDLGKIESDTIDLVSSSFSLSEWLQRLKLIAMSMYLGRDIAVKFSQKFEDDLWIHGDKNRLTQVLLNLISNAFKYTDQGEIEITISYNRSHQKLDFSVTDSGVGISEIQLKNIFNQYYRVDHGDKKERPGTGLGLYLVKELIEKMGGEITVISKVGVGSRFSVEVPMGLSIEGANGKSRGFCKLPPNLKILVADDNLMILKITKKMLEDSGAQVDFAYNGKEAVEKAASHDYDLVLMDTNMPILDGLQATAEIRKAEMEKARPGKTMKIFSYSANSGEREKETGFYDGFIVKPTSLEDLVAGICMVLSKKSS
jgi:signal transduction histidine kinase